MIKRAWPALVAFLVALAPAAADPPDNLACACRNAAQMLSLLAEDGRNTYTLNVGAGPYIADGRISIYPGERLVFQFTPTADGLGTPRLVAVGRAAKLRNLPTDDPNAKRYIDPKSGEGYYAIFGGSPYLEGGTAEEHLAGYLPGTMIISYVQVEGHPDMILVVEHNLALPVKYDATMQRVTAAGVRDAEPTSTCPASPRLLASETWPYPLGEIRLANFRFESGESLRCE